MAPELCETISVTIVYPVQPAINVVDEFRVHIMVDFSVELLGDDAVQRLPSRVDRLRAS